MKTFKVFHDFGEDIVTCDDYYNNGDEANVVIFVNYLETQEEVDQRHAQPNVPYEPRRRKIIVTYNFDKIIKIIEEDN